MGDRYTIYITGPDRDAVLVTATVEVAGEGARITQVRAELAAGDTIPYQLASIDFSVLIRTASMLPGSPAAPVVTGPPPEPGRSPDIGESPILVADKPAEGDPRAPDGAEPASTSSAAAGDAAGPHPMPSDFAVNYWRLGSIAKVARHYGVPHRIAQDWIKALQQQGKATNPWPKRSMRSSR
jgi:hypothetical protein